VIATRCSPGKLSAGTPTVITSPSGDHIVFKSGTTTPSSDYRVGKNWSGLRHDVFLTFSPLSPNKHLEIFLRKYCSGRTTPFAIDRILGML